MGRENKRKPGSPGERPSEKEQLELVNNTPTQFSGETRPPSLLPFICTLKAYLQIRGLKYLLQLLRDFSDLT